MPVHPSISEHVPQLEVDESPRDFALAKRAGVGRGLYVIHEGVAMEFSGEPYDAFLSMFLGPFAHHDDEYSEHPDKEYGVAYDFVNEKFYGSELAAIEEFIEEHSLD